MQEMEETQFRSLGREDPLEEEMTTHSNILAWEIPWTEEPGGLCNPVHWVAKSWTRLSDFTIDCRLPEILDLPQSSSGVVCVCVCARLYPTLQPCGL